MLKVYSGNDRAQDLHAYEGKQLRMYRSFGKSRCFVTYLGSTMFDSRKHVTIFLNQNVIFFAFLAHLSRRLIGEFIDVTREVRTNLCNVT